MGLISKLRRTVKNTVKSMATPEGLVTFAVMAATGGLAAPGMSLSSMGTAAFWKAGAISALKTIGLSAVASALAPTPKSASGISAEDLGARTVQFRSPVAAREIVYGQVRKSGVITDMYSQGSNNNELYITIALSAAEADSLPSIYLNDAKVKANLAVSTSWTNADAPVGSDTDYRNYAYFKWVKGDINTSGFANNGGTGNNWIDRYDGIAALQCKLIYNTTKFPQGIPKISVVIKGKPVYDPRDGTTAYSNNPALCIRDYLLDSKYGVGCSSDEIDEQSFEDAADACEEQVFTTDKYQLDGIVDTSKSPRSIINDMLTTCAGTLTYTNGKFALSAAEYPSVDHTLTEDDFHGPLSVMTKTSMRDRFNAVKCIYYDDNFAEIKDLEIQESNALLTEDNFEKKYISLSLPFTGFEIQAEILSRLYLARARDQISFTCVMPLKRFGIDIGDVASVTLDRYNWSAKPFQCTSWNFTLQGSDLAIEATFKEITEDFFGANNVSQITTVVRDETLWNTQYVAWSTAGVNLTNRKRVRLGNYSSNGSVFNGYGVGFDEWTDPNITKIFVIEEGTDLYGISRYSYDNHSDWSGTGPALAIDATNLQGTLLVYNFGRIIGGAGAGGGTDSAGEEGDDGGCAIRIENAPTDSSAVVRIINHGIIAGGGGGGGKGGDGATVISFDYGFQPGGDGGNGDYGAGWSEYTWAGDPMLVGEDGLSYLPGTTASDAAMTPYYNINNPIVINDATYGDYDVYAGIAGRGGYGGNWGESGDVGVTGGDGQSQQNPGLGPLAESGNAGQSGGSAGEALDGEANIDSFVNYGSVYGNIVA